MGRSKVIPYIIIGLAALGLFAMLINNPLGLFKWLGTLLIFGIVIFTLIKFIFRNNSSTSNDMKKYKQALKQSKQRYQTHQKSSNRMHNNSSQLRRKKRPTHLRVIEGQKSKDKNRATF